MAAVIDIQTGERIRPSAPEARPRLRLVHGGRTAWDPVPARAGGVARRVFLVRRIVAVAVVCAAVLLAAQGMAAIGRLVAAAAEPNPEASGLVHVVHAGDTAWSIAARYAPGMDRRDAVDDLLALNGDRVLRPGRELRLPASFR